MDMTIKPYEAVGPIRFGMSVEEVRRAIGEKVQTFEKAPLVFPDLHPVDAFDEVGVHVCYKKSGVCEAIELFPPATPSFLNARLLCRQFSELLGWFTSLDEGVVRDEAGFKSFKFGIGITVSLEDLIESVIVFDEPGYYESEVDMPLDKK